MNRFPSCRRRTGRRAYGIEIDLLYVDTAIERWERMTGQPARHPSGRTFADIGVESRRFGAIASLEPGRAQRREKRRECIARRRESIARREVGVGAGFVTFVGSTCQMGRAPAGMSALQTFVSRFFARLPWDHEATREIP